MTDTSFIVTEASTWLARGRSPAEAAALATAWREFPDLPAHAPPADRLARTRQRIDAIRPITEATQRRTEQERQHRNFAFTQAKVDRGEADERERAILRARAEHDHDWNLAVRYADGWHAARAGWPYRPTGAVGAPHALERSAYDQGFREAGGEPDDLFDAARRSLAVLAPAAAAPVPAARPLPSSWPKPTDDGRPTPWPRRLAIVSEYDPQLDGAVPGPRTRSAAFRTELRRRSQGAATVIVLSASEGFAAAGTTTATPLALSTQRADQLIADPAQRDRLRALALGDYDDLLVAAHGEHLRVIDALADALPLCRRMERTRNTPLQQRAHLSVWLDRGVAPGTNAGAGHIRWGKVAKGLTAGLGEFTARYAGKAPGRGHRILVELAGGRAAEGYVAADGLPLAPEVLVGSKARLRPAMADALRRFGGATRLNPVRAPRTVAELSTS